MSAQPIPLRIDRSQYYAELGDRVLQKLSTSVRWLTAEQLADALEAPANEVWRILLRLHARRLAVVHERRMVLRNGQWCHQLAEPKAERLATCNRGVMVWTGSFDARAVAA